MCHWLHDITLSSNASELLGICFPSILVVVLVLIIIKHAAVRFEIHSNCFNFYFISFKLYFILLTPFFIRAAGSSITNHMLKTTKLLSYELLFARNLPLCSKAMNRPSGSGSFEVLTLGLTLGNGSRTDFGASQCIPMGSCRCRCRLTLGVFIP